ncbi:MAG: hypothetical protein DME34_04380 [Verrucomicrobia bacterium]|nr:MAG: hypothetical protein DME34_04380 [Verrucomicrobiota bacterium]
MKTAVASLVLSLLVCGSAYADEHPSVDIKSKSSFQMDSGGRNPFWPIGFKPAAQLTNMTGRAFDVPLSAFLLTSITLDQGTRFAIINGKAMQEGQQFSLRSGTQTYQLRVKAIEDGRVILTCSDGEILVPLRRK